MEKKDLENGLLELTDRERQIIELKYGFYDGTPKSLEEIAEIYGVTPERIRQIEAKAIRKLRVRKRVETPTEEITKNHYTAGPLEELDLSVRTYNCLRRAGISTFEELCNLKISELQKIPNLGKKCTKEILIKIAENL